MSYHRACVVAQLKTSCVPTFGETLRLIELYTIVQSDNWCEVNTLWLKVDPRLSIPMYRQIIDGVREQIARGILKPGERLPTVRELAADISVNYNTVAKAYQELERERDKVIELIQGRGTFVSVLTEPLDVSTRQRELREAMKRWMVDAHYANMTAEALRQMFDEVLDEWIRSKGGTIA